MLIHYYNPGYEASVSLALRGGQSFTPSKNVALLRRDLAALPVYWAKEDEGVLVPETLSERLRLPSFRTKLSQGEVLEPWGRAPELKQYGEVPWTLSEMDFWGNRLLSVSLFEAVLKADGGRLFPREAKVPEVVLPGSLFPVYPHVEKRILSSSGRGVTFHPEGNPERRRNGTGEPVIAEPLYPKTRDLGFEFEVVEGGEIRYLGLSLFDTETGRYTGNALHHPEKETIEARYEEYISLLKRVLGQTDLRGYVGPLGVDTLLYSSDEGERTAPLVEVNIRRTMGHLSLELEKRYPEASRFEIRYGDFGELVTREPLYLRPRSTEPLRPGVYPLTPVLPDTRFVAVIEV